MSEDHDWQMCKDNGCPECDRLISDGIIIACDECQNVGHSDADGWNMGTDGRLECAECSTGKGAQS